jgi:cyanate permease
MVASGLGRVELTVTYMLGTILSSFVLPWGGRAYDRYGARVVMVLLATMMGGTLYAMGRMDLWVLGISDSLGVSLMFPALVLGCLGLRFLGQGMIAMVSRNMVMKWFEKRRGVINGILVIATSAGLSAGPIVLNDLSELYGWRGAWTVMALVVGVGFAGFAWLFYRDNPEDCGLDPDGFPTVYVKGMASSETVDYTLVEAKRTRAFWIFTLSLSTMSLYGTALPFHLISIFAEAGYNRASAVSIFLPAWFIALPVSFFGSWLTDHVKLKYHLILFHIGMICYAGGVLGLHLGWGRTSMIVGNGICTAMVHTLGSVVWPKFYGRKYLGAISGYAQAFRQVLSSLGPVLFGLSLEWTGTYRTGAWVCLGFVVPLFVAAFFVEAPKGDRRGPRD